MFRITARIIKRTQAGNAELLNRPSLATFPIALGTITAPAKPTAKIIPNTLPWTSEGNFQKVTPTVVGKHGAKASPANIAKLFAKDLFEQPIITKITMAAITAAAAIIHPPLAVRSKFKREGKSPVTSRPAIIAIAKNDSSR